MTHVQIPCNSGDRSHLREINGFAIEENRGVRKRERTSSRNGAILPQVKMASENVQLEDFDILKVLGKGAYGKVYLVRKMGGVDNRKVYAMKAVNKSRIVESKTDMRHTRTERDVLVSVSHPFLIKLFYAFETSQRLYFVQEFCRGGELFRLMETERMFLEDDARFYLCEIVCALEYLHSLDIVYRDLKTENIMLDSSGHIKLIDFGLSKVFDDGVTLTNTFCGTVEYMAPEVVIKSPGHGKPADWWSFGIFMFDLLTGRSPFHSNKGKKETKEKILKGRFSIPPFLSHSAGDLIRRLLRRNVDRRLGTGGASEIRDHVFFEHVEWDLVEKMAYIPPHIPAINAKDETDVSQFDPRFTSKTPKESDCETKKDGNSGGESSARGSSGSNFAEGLFGDFDWVSPEVVSSRESSFGEMDELQKDLLAIHIRYHGD